MTDTQIILEKYWGHTAFRPLQNEIIDAVLQGNDTLAILPTGGGKSICFQVPALAKDGLCLVVSPLIALMKDQVENLKKRGIPALLIHSGMSRPDVVQTLKNATNNYFKFLYVSPERLETSLFKEYLPAIDVNLIAVDEAHCISQWGYDFRPSYLRIAELRKELPGVPVLALTASATEEVREDVCARLTSPTSPLTPVRTGMGGPLQRSGERDGVERNKREGWSVFRQSFERKNLSYSVFNVDSKLTKLVHVLQKVGGSAIVYCKSRKRTTEIAALLQMHNISATFYHAGLNNDERSKRQTDWINDKVRVMVSTNAFGMGIDKPDVRTVVHVDTPDCLENYYQEAGRAGRDGKKAYAVLLYETKDLEELAQLHTLRYPNLETIKKVYDAVVNFLQIPAYTGQDKSFSFRFEEFVQNFGLPATKTLYALKALESDGWFDFNERSFLSSMLVFSTSKTGLYEFYKSHPVHENLLTSLLRTYEGIFDYPSFISEKLIAKILKKEEADIETQLKTISAFGVINYMPRNEEPQIIFRKNRVPAGELSFNLMQYYKRRDVFIARTKKMIAYTNNIYCRSFFISEYFGDATAKACGVCDNCLRLKATELSVEEFENISSLVLTALSKSALTVDELLLHLPALKKEKLWKVIDFLQAEGKLRVDGLGRLGLTNFL